MPVSSSGLHDPQAASPPSLFPPQMHRTPRAERQWRGFRAILANATGSGRAPSPPLTQQQCPMDTVGAVVVDARGHVASGVSSGGIALKQEGRVGEAALFGAGCWAAEEGREGEELRVDVDGQGSDEPGRSNASFPGSDPARPLLGIAVSTTGVGERVSACLLSKTAAEAVHAAAGQRGVSSVLRRALERSVLKVRPGLQGTRDLAGGDHPSIPTRAQYSPFHAPESGRHRHPTTPE